MRTVTTDNSAKSLVSVDTPFTDAEAIERLQVLCREQPGNRFAADLLSAARNYKTVSRNRMVWIHKLVCDHFLGSGSKGPSSRYKPWRELPAIARLFINGRKHKERPLVRFATRDGRAIRFAFSEVAGRRPRIYVGNGLARGNPDAKLNGYIDIDVKSFMFHETAELTADARRFIEIFEKYPSGVTSLYGRVTTRCIFCRIKLTDERSVAVGYGPVCAENHGLPWGEPQQVPVGVDAELRKLFGSDDHEEVDEYLEESGI